MVLFPYYGGKGKLAQKYPEPYYGHIVEPFAGGASYALRHRERRAVTLYDIDPKIVAVWRWLIAATQADLLALPVLRHGERVASCTSLSDPERWFLALWAEPGSSRGTGGTTVSTRGWTDGWARHRQRVVGEIESIDHWTVHLGPYSEAPDIEATWFIDPPYQGGDSTAGDGYRHGKDRLDFTALGEWTRARQGQVIACDHEDASWLPFRPLAGQRNQGNVDGRTEVVYLQGPQPMTDRLGRVQRRRRPGEMIMRYRGDR